MEDDDVPGDCWNCGGEGVVYSCFDEICCVDPEDGCDECARPCEICTRRPTRQEP